LALRISQESTYEGPDYWKWAVWLDGAQSDLDSVDHVVYTLHPTFPNPVRTVSNRSTAFRLETAGWGTFTLYAKVAFVDGTFEHLEHELELFYPDDAPAPA
jgi:transcription initiation factor IIF auxiliary subunit